MLKGTYSDHRCYCCNPEEDVMTKMPRGWKEPDGKVKIAIKLDQDVFDDVARNAEKRNLSFSDSANEVLKCGLFDLKEAEEL